MGNWFNGGIFEFGNILIVCDFSGGGLSFSFGRSYAKGFLIRD